jgi:PIN domain nuclease of toxin-antitoxin system
MGRVAVIVLDTHIWIWWVHGDACLPHSVNDLIRDEEPNGLGISAISCWEVAKLVERKRLELPLAVEDWIDRALGYPGTRLLPLSPAIAIE